MNEQAYYRQSPDAVCTEPEPGKCVVLQLDTGEYHALNATATSLWHRLENPNSLAGLVDSMVAQYGLDADQASSDAQEFLDGMLARKLIVRA